MSEVAPARGIMWRRSDRRPCTDDPAGNKAMGPRVQPKRGNQRPTKSPFFERLIRSPPAAVYAVRNARTRSFPRDDIRGSGRVET